MSALPFPRTQFNSSRPPQENPVSVRIALTPLLFVALAFGAWYAGLQQIDVRRVTDLGLVSVMPPLSFIALAVLTIHFALNLRARPMQPVVLFFHIVVLIVMLFGIAPMVEPLPRFESSYKHVGITDYILRNGTVDPTIDAYFNWPGFFILAAFVTKAMGLASPMALVPWTPVFLNLIYFLPLSVLARTLTRDARGVWLGLWLFYIANWVGQDYFSPQGLSYFLFLVVLATLTKWFRARGANGNNWLRPREAIYTTLHGWQRAGLLAFVLGLIIFMVPSHQLTPFALFAAVALLALMQRITPRGLPYLIAIAILVWLCFMAVPYLSGHAEDLVRYIGQVGANVDSNIVRRVRGSEEHQFVVLTRVAMTLALTALALVGIVRRVRAGHWDLTFVLLAVAPFGLIIFGNYGGELMLRVYLFALPALALLAAMAFFPTHARDASGWTTLCVIAVACSLVAGFFVTRYGNERMENFSRQELAAVEFLYATAPAGALLIGGSFNAPWRHEGYELYRYGSVEKAILQDDRARVENFMRARGERPAFLILTRSQQAHLELFRGLSPGAWTEFEHALVVSGRFKLIFENEDAKIFQLNDPTFAPRAPGYIGRKE